MQTKNVNKMFSIIKAAFMQRRKTLLNSLTNGNIFSNKQQASEAFEKLNINKNARAEELTIEQFAELANYTTERTE